MKLYVERVRLDRQGYDPRGKYWGAVGRGVDPLYRVSNAHGSYDEPDVDEYVRAPSGAEAKKRVARRIGVTITRRDHDLKNVAAQHAEEEPSAVRDQRRSRIARMTGGRRGHMAGFSRSRGGSSGSRRRRKSGSANGGSRGRRSGFSARDVATAYDEGRRDASRGSSTGNRSSRRRSGSTGGSRSWPDDFAGHSRASRKGWRRKKSTKKRRSSGRSRSRDEAKRDLSRTSRGRSGVRRSWPDDYAGHSKASKKGWRRKKRASGRGRRDESRSNAERDRRSSSRSRSRRSSGMSRRRSGGRGRGSESRSSERRTSRRRRGRDVSRSWEGQRPEHAHAAALGWRRVGGAGWRPKRAVYKGPEEARRRLRRRARSRDY